MISFALFSPDFLHPIEMNTVFVLREYYLFHFRFCLLFFYFAIFDFSVLKLPFNFPVVYILEHFFPFSLCASVYLLSFRCVATFKIHLPAVKRTFFSRLFLTLLRVSYVPVSKSCSTSFTSFSFGPNKLIIFTFSFNFFLFCLS